MRQRMPPPQNGIFVVLFAVLALVLLSFTALALDAAQLYRRYAILKSAADAAALAAARELDGTEAGRPENGSRPSRQTSAGRPGSRGSTPPSSIPIWRP